MIYLASDHAGYELKKHVKQVLDNSNAHYQDLGVHDDSPADYPEIASMACKKIEGTQDAAILICGTGTGMCMAANRYKHVRAGVGYDEYSAKKMREDEDANVLCLRARQNDQPTENIINAFLNTPFSGQARHGHRIQLLEEMP